MPEALAINDRFLVGLTSGLAPSYADDHILGHHTWSYLLAWQHWIAQRPQPRAPRAGRVHFPRAGLLIERRGACALYLALNKGGVFKFFRDGHLVRSDTNFSVVTRDGKNAVANLIDDYDIQLGEPLIVTGQLGWAKDARMTPLRLVLLRLFMLTLGRFFPDLVRKILQRLLIGENELRHFVSSAR